jgi:uncharacterized protein YidB (DUF937 family)
MAIFDTLIDDVAIQFGLGSNAGLIVREILSAITGTPGGVGGFLKNLKTAGLSPEVASWLGHANAAPLAAAEVDRAFGSTAIGGIASRLGLAPTLVSSAVGYALPKVINLLTPGGVIPTSLPAEVTNFATPVTRPEAAPYSTVRRVATPYVAPAAQMAPRLVDVYHAAEAHDEPAMTSWLWPLLGAPWPSLGLAFCSGRRAIGRSLRPSRRRRLSRPLRPRRRWFPRGSRLPTPAASRASRARFTTTPPRPTF